MGLDMWLSKKRYVKKTGKIIPETQSNRNYLEEIAYWRKANAIHGWFVDNCQDGIDKCQRTKVTRAQLFELRDLCREVMTNKSPDLIKPRAGFFFGSTDIDDFYYSYIEKTFKVLDRELSENSESCRVSYFYESSW